MSNNKQPAELLVLKNKHKKSKEFIEERRATEVKTECNNIVAPSHLTKKQKERFNYLSSELIRAKIMDNLDVETLARYCILEEQYNTIAFKIVKMDPLDFEYDSLLNKQMKLFAALDKLNNALCFNIIARCKVSVPKEEKKPANKFEKFTSNG